MLQIFPLFNRNVRVIQWCDSQDLEKESSKHPWLKYAMPRCIMSPFLNFAGNYTWHFWRNIVLQTWRWIHPTANEFSEGPGVCFHHEHNADKSGTASSLHASEANLLQAQGTEILQSFFIHSCPFHCQSSTDPCRSTFPSYFPLMESQISRN